MEEEIGQVKSRKTDSIVKEETELEPIWNKKVAIIPKWKKKVNTFTVKSERK
ncbi:MAG: hypothetical protein VKK42_15440 [Lyngbya sp.]|nr:hypothetical protein [Lyngbya sp.]